jgi:hypothetical protein
MELTSQDDLTMDIVESGVVTWDDLIRTVKQFHYGRNQNRDDLELVWLERKGTCSSKHAFLKHVADLNSLKGIELVLCIYEMNAANTPGIGNGLESSALTSIPEAHCYLRTHEGPIDATTLHADLARIQDSIVEEQVIQPDQVKSYKVEYHKNYIKTWADKTDLSWEEVWELREDCIRNLEQ